LWDGSLPLQLPYSPHTTGIPHHHLSIPFACTDARSTHTACATRDKPRGTAMLARCGRNDCDGHNSGGGSGAVAVTTMTAATKEVAGESADAGAFDGAADTFAKLWARTDRARARRASLLSGDFKMILD